MNRPTRITLAVLLATAPFSAQSVELAGKQLELYGKVHLSLDYGDPDASGQDSQFSVSNNSTRIGFRGQHEVNPDLMLGWQYEQGVGLDSGGGQFGTRNSFLSVQGGMGEIRAGHHDTPSKSMGSAWAMFSDTVGDRRAILGAYTGYGNVLNDRADNALLYLGRFSNLSVSAMYSSSNPSADTSGGLDDNDFDLGSLALSYDLGQLNLSAAAESWSLDPVNGTEKVDNLRLAARYRLESLRFGAIYETTDSDDDVFNRDAWGVNAAMALNSQTEARVQLLMADDYEGVSDSGASQIALGLFSQLDEATEVYAVFTTTNNDDNAQYKGIDGGHGDELGTEAGGSPSAISVGGVLKF
ncbi:MAG: porin [Pseudomonadota bacterium]